MKKILITGTNSYIGKRLMKWLGNNPGGYVVDSISLRNDLWRERCFSEYDVVFHCAGIAHIKETKDNAELYYKVNRDLAFETAEKAKNDGVKQFIFLSSMSVYGIERGVIDKNSPLNPKSNYGKSKLQAEGLITALNDDFFKVVIIRPPMVYGRGCKGNYLRLAKLSMKISIFPDIVNIRSMIHVGNLCEFIKLLVDDYNSGTFFPQNEEYVCTTEMVTLIGEFHGNKIRLTKFFNPFIKMCNFSSINKLFGNLYYDKGMSKYKKDYCVKDFKNSILETEKRG